MQSAATLVIDDDPAFGLYMSELVPHAGFGPTVCDGDAATVLSGTRDLNCFDRIICDLNMPGVDGIQFIEHLAETRWDGALIIVSGEPDSVIRAASRFATLSGLNFRGALKKPVLPEALAAVMRDDPESGVGDNNRKPTTAATHAAIMDAVERAALYPVYQPQLNLISLKVDAFECLMRLRLEDGSLVGPTDFFHLLSEAQEEQLTAKFVQMAMRDYALAMRVAPGLTGAFNLPPRLLVNSSLPDRLRRFCKRFEIPPSQMIIEVTESEPFKHNLGMSKAMSRLRMAGFGLALDDFGAGYANIHELGDLPFTHVKTDLSFGQNIESDRFSRAAVEFAVKAAAQLGLEITIEGIESIDALTCARSLGGHRAQGFIISKPLPRAKALNLAINQSQHA